MRSQSPLRAAIMAYQRVAYAELELEKRKARLQLLLALLPQEDFQAYAEETTAWDQRREQRQQRAEAA